MSKATRRSSSCAAVSSLAEAAIAAMRNTARPGVTEAQVYAAMIAAMIERGGEIPAMIMWSAGPPEPVGLGRSADSAALRAGDLLRVEVEGRYAGYCGQVTQMAVLGRVPPALSRHVASCSRRRCSLQRGPAARHHARRSRARVPLRLPRARLRIKFLMHGRGLGDDAPDLCLLGLARRGEALGRRGERLVHHQARRHPRRQRRCGLGRFYRGDARPARKRLGRSRAEFIELAEPGCCAPERAGVWLPCARKPGRMRCCTPTSS